MTSKSESRGKAGKPAGKGVTWRDLRGDGDKAKADRQVALRCTEDEYTQIIRNAQRAKCKSIAAYMKLCLLEQPPIDERAPA